MHSLRTQGQRQAGHCGFKVRLVYIQHVSGGIGGGSVDSLIAGSSSWIPLATPLLIFRIIFQHLNCLRTSVQLLLGGFSLIFIIYSKTLLASMCSSSRKLVFFRTVTQSQHKSFYVRDCFQYMYGLGKDNVTEGPLFLHCIPQSKPPVLKIPRRNLLTRCKAGTF